MALKARGKKKSRVMMMPACNKYLLIYSLKLVSCLCKLLLCTTTTTLPKTICKVLRQHLDGEFQTRFQQIYWISNVLRVRNLLRWDSGSES